MSRSIIMARCGSFGGGISLSSFPPHPSVVGDEWMANAMFDEIGSFLF